MKRYFVLSTALLWAGACADGLDVTTSSSPAAGTALHTGQMADGILGQRSPRARSAAQTNGSGFGSPMGLAVSGAQQDGSVQLFVVDFDNDRVLGWREARTGQIINGSDADLVINQADMFTTDHSGVPQSPIDQRFQPEGVAVDASNRLYVYDDARVIIIDDPFAQDTYADLELQPDELPTVVRSVRPLSRGRVAVVGFNEIRFFLQGSAERLKQSTLTSPCGNNLVDVAEVSNVLFVACEAGIACNDYHDTIDDATNPEDPADCLDADGNTGACVQDSCGGVFVYRLDANTSFPDPAVTPQVAYRGMWSVRAIAIKSDRLLVAEEHANRVVRFSSVESHANARLTNPAGTMPYAPFHGALAGNTSSDAVYGQSNPRNRVSNYYPSATARLSEHGLNGPMGLALDPSNGVWIVDHGNNRVLHYSDALGLTPSRVADLVLGQPDYTLGYPNRLESSSFAYPVWGAFDGRITGGRMYVVDRYAHRVLAFDGVATIADAAPASLIIGQSSGLTYLPNAGNPTLSGAGLWDPACAAIDANGSLYVADAGNGRVLRYDELDLGNLGATAVYGVTDLSTSGSVLGNMYAIAVKDMRLFVALGNRIFMLDAPATTTPVRVFGQPQNDYVTNTCNRGVGTPAADTLCDVRALAFDSQGALWVADAGNHRILRFDAPDSVDNIVAAVTADGVVGQPDFTTWSVRGGSLTDAFHLTSPGGIALDGSDRLWVADTGSHRVLLFPTPREADPVAELPAASLVLGQRSFAGTGANAGLDGIGAQTLDSPASVAVSDAGDLVMVVDRGNSRVLRFTGVAPLEFTGGGGTYQVQAGGVLTIGLTLNKAATLSLSGAPAQVTLSNTNVIVNAEALRVGTKLRFTVLANIDGPPPELASASIIVNVVDKQPELQRGATPPPRERSIDESCACAGASSSGAAWLSLGVLCWLRRRRRA